MKDEIKEILDVLTFNKEDILNGICNVEDFISREKIIKLLVHITNLQEENQKLNNKTKRLNSKIKVLEHNCKQAEDSCRQHRLANKNKKRRLQRREEQINLYKTRNEKAIEYIKIPIVYETNNIEDLEKTNRSRNEELLNILQGKSDE